MHTSCAMMVSSVTPLVEDEEAKVDGALEAEGVAIVVRGYLGRSCAALRQTVVTSMAHMNVKWRDLG